MVTNEKQTVFGFAPTAVIRRCGREHIEFQTIRAFLAKAGIAVADATIRAQQSAGRLGERGEPAPLTDGQLAEIRSCVPAERPVPDKGILKQFMFYTVNDLRAVEAFEIWTWTRSEEVARAIALKEWARWNKGSGRKMVAVYRTKAEAVSHK